MREVLKNQKINKKLETKKINFWKKVRKKGKHTNTKSNYNRFDEKGWKAWKIFHMIILRENKKKVFDEEKFKFSKKIKKTFFKSF